MFPESAKPSQSASEGDQKPTRMPLDKEVRDMVNAITHHIADLHKPGGTLSQHHHRHHEVDEDDQHGIRIVTLAGTNMGATMRSELQGDRSASMKKNRFSSSSSSFEGDDNIEDDNELDDSEGTYVNSNFQAVNNSIMMSSSYNTNDPGVHLDITDVFDQHHLHPHPHHGHRMMDKKKPMGKRNKDKDVLRSDQNSGGNSG